ncbi:hypothetical protein K493DRAFT_336260 [Basidiobolus meristosporus CBS 931.73]|uniref:Ribosomal protein L7Ae/L30e/S12e/Gadd45 domain-containing protein n=1 Tax=Basidiobolus meristosporus CBS 931.73 TaxID=1314790 RepID=A0A1Y1YJG8_9FUNG|nr:hypothetical protein K493DRAFT_336260 [Basidiobolus meristosporus CBS 931.73]|eukprot:ORX98149.1 hypothetical protein K493DRAFT_336260 [Basidiobolus meristosporus CBS 931.73]
MSTSKQLPNEGKKRLVIKNVLADPFKVDWPALEPDVELQVVERLCDIISPVGKYRVQNNVEARAARKQKASGATPKAIEKPSPPQVSTQFSYGLREIIRGLSAKEKASSNPTEPVFTLILACHEDIEPKILLSDVLTLAVQKNVLVCGLSKGTTQKLGLALGQSRVTCLGVKHNAVDFSDIIDMLTPILRQKTSFWGQLTSSEPVLQRTRIKRLRTFAPILSKTADSKKAKK